jgi:RNA polymerase sigma factor for flagellar operon FliA
MTATASDTAALIEAHLPLVRQVLSSVAGHFPRHADREEMAQAARLGLVEAAHRFDPDRGVPFERWAALRIRGAILDSVRAVDFAPRTLRSAMRQAEVARVELEGELRRTPTAHEHADRMGISVRELTTLEGKAHRALVISLDAGVDRSEDEPRTLACMIVDQNQPNPLALLENIEQSSYVRDALLELPERLRDVVTSYFLDGEASSSIATRLGVTESRVSQMRSEALGMLRTAMTAVYAEAPAETGHRDRAFAAQVAGRSSFRDRLSLSPRAVA